LLGALFFLFVLCVAEEGELAIYVWKRREENKSYIGRGRAKGRKERKKQAVEMVR